jgi:uncharacterized membrane protein YcaP (DUF421 family)
MTDVLSSAVQPLWIGVVVYLALVVLLRISGKRTLSKWNAFDFVVTIALGSILATALTSSEVAALQGVAALALLVGLQFVITWSAVRWAALRRWTKARPRLLLANGRFDDQAMRQERVTRGEVRAAIRAAGYGDLERVDAVVLETDGSVSVIAQAGGASALSDVDGIEAAQTTRIRSDAGDEAAGR